MEMQHRTYTIQLNVIEFRRHRRRRRRLQGYGNFECICIVEKLSQ